MTARPIRYQRQVSDRKGKIFYTSITSLSHISKVWGFVGLSLQRHTSILPSRRRLPLFDKGISAANQTVLKALLLNIPVFHHPTVVRSMHRVHA